jgi:intracellular sulfur oxidation DsrE/DsrF family protein
LKVLYHIDDLNVGLAKYIIDLNNKNMETEGCGPDKVDDKVVVNGTGLKLFDKETVDPALKKILTMIIEKGIQPEMCQVAIKIFNKPLESYSRFCN